MENLKQELKLKILEELNLEDLTIEDLQDDTLLFGEKIGLDSIDALEIIVMLDKDYGVKIINQQQGIKVFHSIQTIADFIEESRKA